MTETIIVLSLAGLLAGFVLSMPLAGPISILITSNALKGRLHYCRLATLGASIADFVFIFIAVYGITKLYKLYQPYIPYVLMAGALFLLFVGYRIYRTEMEMEQSHDPAWAERIKNQKRGGFFTGFMISFLNPSLFVSWLTSSFLIISFVSAMGFNTGGLAQGMTQTMEEIHRKERMHDTTASGLEIKDMTANKSPEEQSMEQPGYFPMVLALSYAFFVSLGSIAWFFLLSWLLVKHRHRISTHFLNRIIRVLGLALCLFGLVLGYKGIQMM